MCADVEANVDYVTVMQTATGKWFPALRQYSTRDGDYITQMTGVALADKAVAQGTAAEWAAKRKIEVR